MACAFRQDCPPTHMTANMLIRLPCVVFLQTGRTCFRAGNRKVCSFVHNGLV